MNSTVALATWKQDSAVSMTEEMQKGGKNDKNQQRRRQQQQNERHGNTVTRTGRDKNHTDKDDADIKDSGREQVEQSVVVSAKASSSSSFFLIISLFFSLPLHAV